MNAVQGNQMYTENRTPVPSVRFPSYRVVSVDLSVSRGVVGRVWENGGECYKENCVGGMVEL